MYKISVPVMNKTVKRVGKEQTLAELRRFDAERVFLALDCYETDEERRRESLSTLAENCRFFKENGLEVGAWIWTFWLKSNDSFRCMRSIKGTEISEFMCPTDESFVSFACAYAQDIARCGIDLIQYDDDFRYGWLSDAPACLCDGHMAAIRTITGEEVTRAEMEKHILSGEKNKYRDAYLQANGDALRRFASAIRAAVDQVNPTIRIGACSCMSSWDIDGTSATEIAHILAGSTKPFTRLIGAPYWARTGDWGRLQDVVEMERMESAWTRDGEIEIMAEGDAYPRPRSQCPASYLEGFDTAIRASGCTDGILKYGIDYHSNTDYETGYARFHERNREVYAAIDKLFTGKQSCGVRVYEPMHKIADMIMPTAVNNQVNIEEFIFSKAARTLAHNAIPTVYEGEGICGIVFDESARNLPPDALKKGLILDIAAAEILSERGIDVGIEHIGKATTGDCEHFITDNNHISACGTIVYDVKLKDGAEVLSDMETPEGIVPISYRYENKSGNRFLVLNINTRAKQDNLLKHYARSAQYADIIPWLGGNTLPAYTYGNPALYLQCKKGDGSMAVGLWNFFADPALSPTVQLDEEYASLSCVNCEGRIHGKSVTLTDIPAFGFAFFEVKKK
ncbi:MAG: hypothetical protein J6D31_01440 [Clostridia bacterium]|nr:hypothetical protein [Clostridia bacterium]